MDAPLSTWYCDVCGDKIQTIDRGYVIWRSDGHPHDFKIIHQSDCDQKDHSSSAALKDFLGPGGLSRSLRFLCTGPIRQNCGESYDLPEIDLSEFTDFMRRLQVPYYEQARRSFSNPDLLSDLSDWNEYAPYLPEELKRIIEDYPADN